MPSLRDSQARRELLLRLDRLTATSVPRWGRFDAARMLCHVRDCLEMALGDRPTRPAGKRLFHLFPLKHLLLYWLPFPKGAPTAPELLESSPRDFPSDRQAVADLLNRLAETPPDVPGPQHPLFGRLTNEEWNVLEWKHTAHHLKQFGC
jgi:hypothetical protein